MNILIVSEFTERVEKNNNSRFKYIADLLCGNNEVEIVTSTFSHIMKRKVSKQSTDITYTITQLDEPGYPRNICIRRFISQFVWGIHLKRYLSSRKSPDVIYCAIPSLTAGLFAARYANRHKIKFVIDVQDLWPEAFRMVFDIPVISDIIYWPFKTIANKIYDRADVIIAVSKTYLDRALDNNRKKAIHKVVYIGTDLDTFDYYSKSAPIIDKLPGELWIGYCGTLGSSYDIECLIDAVALIHDSNIRLIIMGDGPKRTFFEQRAKEAGINAEFTGYLPYEQMCSLLSHCDIAVNPINKGAAQSIINKHADYAAAGIPVVSTQESNEYRQLVNHYKMGFNCPAGDSGYLAERLTRLIGDSELRQRMGFNARQCAEELFDRNKTYQTIINTLYEAMS